MIELQPYSDHAAMAVLSSLDPNDLIEAELVRGRSATHLELFADWRSMEGTRLLSLVVFDATTTPRPMSVLGLSHSGQAGVAQAALLSRNHTRFKSQLLEVARKIKTELPPFAEEVGIQRIEARSWADHPTANKFLRFCGFRLETRMPGFGANGSVVFNQFAWTSKTVTGDSPCAS